MFNPFKEIKRDSIRETQLIPRVLNGDRDSLESLILLHQAWIYNLAFSMTGNIHLAEDITQEILIKIITKLSSYDSSQSSFRTWLYRIVVNHIINMKKNKNEEIFSSISSFNDYSDFIDRQPDKRKFSQPDFKILEDEIKTTCCLCMLLCLERRERIVFVLGVIFNVKDEPGAEICEISKDNFRKILSRTRKKIYKFFSHNCSLFKDSNVCKCSDQTENFIKTGAIDPDDLLIKRDSYGTVKEVLGECIDEIEDSYYEFNALFKSQNFLKGPALVAWFRDLLNKSKFKNLFIQ